MRVAALVEVTIHIPVTNAEHMAVLAAEATVVGLVSGVQASLVLTVLAVAVDLQVLTILEIKDQ